MLQVHERLGDFEIICLLGKGGMGEVYEARQFNPDRPVAIKVLAPWLAADTDALQRFMREAAVPANLDHPGIVRIISTGKTESGLAYYAMHLVRGISLAEMIRRGNATPPSDAVTKSMEAVNTPSMATPPGDEAQPPASPAPAVASSPHMLIDYRADRFTTVARIGVQAACALAYAHQQGHLHRDIKPSNLMVDHHDHVYLVDFGLTRGLGPGDSSTQPGIVVGTPWYMSPEQADGKAIDARADIYSLGITLFELATQGLGPWTASREDKHSVLAQVRSGQALPLRTLATGIPPELERIILKAIHLKPKKRYASAAELANELERFTGVESKKLGSAPTRTSRASDWRLALGTVLAATVVLAVVSAILLAPFWRDPHGKVEANGIVPLDDPNPKGPGAEDADTWPESLRKPTLNAPIALMKNNHEPVWKDLLFGPGNHRIHAFHLELNSPAEERVTMLALANPNRRFFEFAVDLNQFKSYDKSLTNDMGVFFGWRRPAETDGHHRYFAIKLDETPREKAPFGCLIIGTGWLIEKRQGRDESGQWFTSFPDDNGIVPIATAKNMWHHLQVQIRDERVTVILDKQTTKEFTLAWARERDRQPGAKLTTQGAVGIWASRGRGFFRNASITALE